MKRKIAVLLAGVLLLSGRAGAQPAWSDSTIFSTPHSDLFEILQMTPSIYPLSAGGHGQPGFLASGFGDVFGTGISFNGQEQKSYLLPFGDALRWPLTFVEKAVLNPIPAGIPGGGIFPHSEEITLRSFWEKADRPFVRVHYLTRDFGREEVFALFQKRANPTLRVQPFGAIGHYTGWRANSGLAFHQAGGQAEKILPGHRLLHVLFFSLESEAGFPGSILAARIPALSNLKRKIQEQRFQGNLRTVDGDSSTRPIVQWQVRRLREEWTNQNPYFYRKNEEISGQVTGLWTGRWCTQNWWLASDAAVSRVDYRSKIADVWRTGIQLGDSMSLSENWHGTAQARLSVGNWEKRRLSLAVGIAEKRVERPVFQIRFEESHGGFLPPVLRDSTSFHWYWICATPLFQLAQHATKQTHFRLLEERFVWPVWNERRQSLVVQVQGVHWLRPPGEFSFSSQHPKYL